MRDHFEGTLQGFVEALFGEGAVSLTPANRWTDDETWFLDQDKTGTPLTTRDGGGCVRDVRTDEWSAETHRPSLLNGTGYQPPLDGTVLLLEDDYESESHHFDRWLTSVLQQPNATASVD